jgi:hypothetical protein
MMYDRRSRNKITHTEAQKMKMLWLATETLNHRFFCLFGQ